MVHTLAENLSYILNNKMNTSTTIFLKLILSCNYIQNGIVIKSAIQVSRKESLELSGRNP